MKVEAVGLVRRDARSPVRFKVLDRPVIVRIARLALAGTWIQWVTVQATRFIRLR